MAELRQFLEEIGRGLKHEVPRREAESVLLETEAHLRERMEALQELGLSPEQAEREAVQAFGGVRPFVNETIDAHRPSRQALDRVIVSLAAAASIVTLAVSFAAVYLMQAYLFLLCFPLLIGLVVASFRARRFIPVKMAAVTIGFFFAFWVCYGATFYSLGAYGGLGQLPKWEVPRVREFYTANTRAGHEADRLAAMRKQLLHSTNPMADAKELKLVHGELVAAPVGYNFGLTNQKQPSGPVITFRPMQLAIALDYWRSSETIIGNLRYDGRTAIQNLSAIDEAERTSLARNMVNALVEVRPITGIWFCFLAGANLLGAMAGQLWRVLRRLRIRIEVA